MFKERFYLGRLLGQNSLALQDSEGERMNYNSIVQSNAGKNERDSEVSNLPLQDRETYHNGLNSLGTTLCKQVIKRIDVEIYKSF
jgi:hypothetical protein